MQRFSSSYEIVGYGRWSSVKLGCSFFGQMKLRQCCTYLHWKSISKTCEQLLLKRLQFERKNIDFIVSVFFFIGDASLT